MDQAQQKGEKGKKIASSMKPNQKDLSLPLQETVEWKGWQKEITRSWYSHSPDV